MKNVFDGSGRRAAVLDAEGFFAWLLPGFADSLRFNRWLQTRTTPPPREGEQIGDLVAELLALGAEGPPWLFLQEFQTEPDPDMFGRMTKQGAQLWIDLRPDDLPGSRYQLAGAVVNLTGTKASLPASRSYRLPTADRVEWTVQLKEVYLAEESADDTLRRVEGGELSRIVLVFVVLMHGAGEPGIIERWLAAASQEPDSRRRAELGSLATILAELKDWSPAWKQALKEWNMRESVAVNEWKREAVVEALQRNVRKLLEKRFGTVPGSVLQRIESVSDTEALERALGQVYDVARPEDLAF
jgi:hypothetical protein